MKIICKAPEDSTSPINPEMSTRPKRGPHPTKKLTEQSSPEPEPSRKRSRPGASETEPPRKKSKSSEQPSIEAKLETLSGELEELSERPRSKKTPVSRNRPASESKPHGKGSRSPNPQAKPSLVVALKVPQLHLAFLRKTGTCKPVGYESMLDDAAVLEYSEASTETVQASDILEQFERYSEEDSDGDSEEVSLGEPWEEKRRREREEAEWEKKLYETNYDAWVVYDCTRYLKQNGKMPSWYTQNIWQIYEREVRKQEQWEKERRSQRPYDPDETEDEVDEQYWSWEKCKKKSIAKEDYRVMLRRFERLCVERERYTYCTECGRIEHRRSTVDPDCAACGIPGIYVPSRFLVQNDQHDRLAVAKKGGRMVEPQRSSTSGDAVATADALRPLIAAFDTEASNQKSTGVNVQRNESDLFKSLLSDNPTAKEDRSKLLLLADVALGLVV